MDGSDHRTDPEAHSPGIGAGVGLGGFDREESFGGDELDGLDENNDDDDFGEERPLTLQDEVDEAFGSTDRLELQGVMDKVHQSGRPLSSFRGLPALGERLRRMLRKTPESDQHASANADDDANLPAPPSPPQAIQFAPYLQAPKRVQLVNVHAEETGSDRQSNGDESEVAALDSMLERSCCVFSRKGAIRRCCMALVSHRFFETLVIFLIFVNSVFLAAYDPMACPASVKEDPTVDCLPSERNEICDIAGKVLTVMFSIEMLIKMIAIGVVSGDETYFRCSVWNYLDFLVVSTGFTDFIPDFDNQFGILRVVRLLRPLRTIGAVKGLRQQVRTTRRHLWRNPQRGNPNHDAILSDFFKLARSSTFAAVLVGRSFDAQRDR